mmetsp:Transcript_9651/g.27919  ORF Transcript_9651/g.27919 Transcript_9651/m.27919 type:complete len:282 (-) Transcript_9651:1191-2036(-)
MVAVLECAAWGLGAIRLCIRRVGALRGVVVGHLRQEVRCGVEPTEAPEDGDKGLHYRDEHRRGVGGEVGRRNLVESDGQSNAVDEADDNDDPHAAQGPDHERRVPQRVAHALASDRVALGALGLDDADRQALLPSHVGVAGDAPNSLRLVVISRLVRVAAEALRRIGWAQHCVVLRSVPRHHILRLPHKALLAIPSVHLTPAVVHAVAGHGLRGCVGARQGVRHGRLRGHHDGDAHLVACVEEAGALALVAADEEEVAEDEEHENSADDREPHANADEETE